MASVSSRFAVAIHIVAAVALYPNERVTSEFLASSIGTNPVVVRRISKMLADAGLIRVRAGVGGAELTRPLQQKDGSVVVPEVLRPFMHGLEVIEPTR